MVEYTVGFVMNPERDKVLLIKKNRPAWQAGKWNGIGGKVEPGENALECMQRECREEAELDLTGWYHFLTLKDQTHDQFLIDFYSIATPEYKNFKSLTDEEIRIWTIKELPDTIPNVPWLLAMALSMPLYRHTKRFEMIEINE